MPHGELKGHYDIAIVGAGAAGSLAAIQLSRFGYDIVLFDKLANYPNLLQSEQLVGGQVHTLEKFNVLQPIVRDLQLVRKAHCYKNDKLIGESINPHYGLSYQTLINRLRSLIPHSVTTIYDRITHIKMNDYYNVLYHDGQEITATLVIIATGLNTKLTQALHIQMDIEKNYSTTIAFDIDCNRKRDVLVFKGENRRTKIDYFTVFPFENNRLRGNIFSFHRPYDLWVHYFKEFPETQLRNSINVTQLGDFTISDKAIRHNDVMRLRGPLPQRVMFVGDAFSTACPSSGCGLTKALNDVYILCNRYIPGWFGPNQQMTGTGLDFYEDIDKIKYDTQAIHDTVYRKNLIMNDNPLWALRRLKERLGINLSGKKENSHTPK